METSNFAPDKILSDLKRFYKNSEVKCETIGSDSLFTIKPYFIRHSDGLKCNTGLLVREGTPYIIVDPGYGDISDFFSNEVKSITVGSNKWYSLKPRYFWEEEKPAYWFVERNLTAFFREKTK